MGVDASVEADDPGVVLAMVEEEAEGHHHRWNMLRSFGSAVAAERAYDADGAGGGRVPGSSIDLFSATVGRPLAFIWDFADMKDPG